MSRSFRYTDWQAEMAGLLGGALSLALVWPLAAWTFADRAEGLVRGSVRMSLVWYFAALTGWLQLSASEWLPLSRRARLVRVAWTIACVIFLVHLGLAFHYYHHWSHTSAVARTAAISGWGQGVWVSYAFALLWTIDVGNWWSSAARYALRPAIWSQFLHPFMLFIVFNGMVVFEKGLIRWAGLVAFAWLAVVARQRWTGTLPNARTKSAS